MLESPQKKPRLYAVTALSSHAKNGMEADGVLGKRGGDGKGGGQAKTKDGLMNVCERAACATEIRHGEIQRYCRLTGA